MVSKEEHSSKFGCCEQNYGRSTVNRGINDICVYERFSIQSRQLTPQDESLVSRELDFPEPVCNFPTHNKAGIPPIHNPSSPPAADPNSLSRLRSRFVSASMKGDNERRHTLADRIFFETGFLIGSHPVWVIAAFVLITVTCSVGLLNFGELNDIEEQFTPLDSPSWNEKRVFDEFNRREGEPYGSKVFVQARDGGTLLRTAQAEALVDLIAFLEHNVTVDGLGYRQLCTSGCNSNDLVTFIFTSLTRNVSAQALVDPKKPDPNVRLTYPTMKLLDNVIYVGDKFFGVDTTKSKSRNDRGGIINNVKLVEVGFQSFLKNATHKALLERWDAKLWEAVQEVNRSSTLLQIVFINQAMIANEVRRTGLSAMPYLVACMVMFVVLCLITTSHPEENHPLAVVIGVITPIFGIATAFGILIGAFGLAYQPIVTVSVFLVLTVGIDDMFLIMAAWRSTDSKLKTNERLGETLIEAGPSICLSTLTNVLSFAIGGLTSTPAIKVFSIYTTVAIAVAFFYQVFIFGALLALSPKKLSCKGPNFLRMVKTSYQCYVKKLSNGLASGKAQIAALLFFIVYSYVIYVGSSKMEVEMKPDKVFLSDSPVLTFFNMEKKYLNNEADKVFVVVQNPGNFTNPRRRDEFLGFVQDIENLDDSSIGFQSTSLILIKYMQYLEIHMFENKVSGFQKHRSEQFSYKMLPRFLEENSGWRAAIHINESECAVDHPRCIQEFLFTTAFRGSSNVSERAERLAKWRFLSAEYADFNITTYNGYNYLCDQLTTVGSIAVATVLTTLVCLAVICIMFIGEAGSILSALLTVFSINAGVFSIMALIGINLDAVALSGLLMAVGFSVDYTAHISYHFAKFSRHDYAERIRLTLLSVGWPSGEACLTTSAASLILMLNNSQLIDTFAKIVLIVILLGFIHAIFLLPVLLITVNRIVEFIVGGKEKPKDIVVKS
uniref:SSD domain-containing protein n=1 Tax=Steinernema glaseri TaxID=37863 RepID=A0A1I7Y070_9BILA